MSDTTGTTSSQSMTAAEAATAFEAMLPLEEGEQSEQEEALEEDQSSESTEVDESEEENASDEEAEGEESEEDEETEQQEQPQKFTVKVDGKEVEVTLEELQKGYSRTEDYTRKTQALAQERKAAQAELEAVRTERAQYSQLLTALQAQLQEAQQPNVDMERLYQEDPIEWVRQRELQRVNQEKALAIQAEQSRLMQEQQKETQKAMQERLLQEKDLLLSAAPELKDPKVAARAKAEWIEAGKAIGLTEQELNSVTDHRILLALRKLAAYDSLVNKRQNLKPEQSAKKIAKPGVAASKPQSSQIKQAQQRLKQTGNVRDAANLFEKFL
jgi:hypothetical protein